MEAEAEAVLALEALDTSVRLRVATHTYVYLCIPTYDIPTCAYIFLRMPTYHMPTHAYPCLHMPTYAYMHLRAPTCAYKQGALQYKGNSIPGRTIQGRRTIHDQYA